MERGTLTRAGLFDEYLIAEEIDPVGVEQSRRYFWSSAVQAKLPKLTQSRSDAGIEKKAAFCIFGLVEQ